VSRAQPNGSFSAPELVVANFGYDAGGWCVDSRATVSQISAAAADV
jgi:hypothetical protein